MLCGNEWFWMYNHEKKSHYISVIRSKSDTRSKEKLIRNLNLIPPLKLANLSIQGFNKIVKHFYDTMPSLTSYFFPNFLFIKNIH